MVQPFPLQPVAVITPTSNIRFAKGCVVVSTGVPEFATLLLCPVESTWFTWKCW